VGALDDGRNRNTACRSFAAKNDKKLAGFDKELAEFEFKTSPITITMGAVCR
jgi:hypothetical protein